MEKNLLKKFIKTAIISTPIIGVYGVTPFFIFFKIIPLFIFIAALIVTFNVGLFWFMNILIIRYAGVENKWKWYTFSYTFVLIHHIFVVAFRKTFSVPDFVTESEHIFSKTTLLVYPFVSLLAINTIILIICNTIINIQKNKNAEIEIQELRVRNLEAQKQVLMQQLQPHFLFNTLSVLKSLIKEEPEEAEDYSIKLSNFLRYSLEVHKSDLVTVAQELVFTNDYMDLQKTRFESSVIFDIKIPHVIYAMQIPAYALQTLVENAIKHNFFTEKRPLHIQIDYIDDYAILVSNNKLPGKIAETIGTGLKNLKQRYQIIANKEIEIIDTNDIFSVKVYLINNYHP